MALPTYDKSKRKSTSFEALPKDAYVVKIVGAKEGTYPSGGACLRIAFDIAEGAHKDFYQDRFNRDTREDKEWPYDAVFSLTIPSDHSEAWIWDNWNTFFADLEDSNSGFVFGGDIRSLKGKLIGGKFHIKQTEKNGNVYDHTLMKWTCVAEDVRQGKAGKLPNDKLVGNGSGRAAAASPASADGFVNNVPDEELPF